MQEFFLEIVSMGINASWMILAVLILRVLFCKSPKWIACFLWVLVGIRLICPWNIESAMSLVPIRLEVPLGYSEKNSDKNDGVAAYINIDHNPIVNRYIKTAKHIPSPNQSSTDKSLMTDNENVSVPGQNEQIVLNSNVIKIAMIMWLCVMIAMLLYFFMSFIYICKKTETATLLRENIWESEFVTSPFVFGLLRPRIYIPYGITQENLSYILAHECTHIKRKDHIIKLSAFFILSVYWFHPLVWVAYALLGRDIELACDEKAAAAMDKQERKKYLLTLLSCSVSKRSASIYPLAFGKIGIKERVIRMKRWKKPSLLLMIATLFAGIIVSLCFLTNPTRQELVDAQEFVNTKETNKDNGVLEVKKALVDLSENTGADGTMLYYVDDNKIIFGGNFGLFVHDKASGKIVQSLDLEYIGCNQTQGDNYCEIAVDKQGQRVYLNPLRQKKLYILDLLSDKLEVKEYPDSDIWKDSSLDLFSVENTKEVSYYNAHKEKMVCVLKEKDFSIGNCAYVEYGQNELEKKGEREYIPLFSQNNQ